MNVLVLLAALSSAELEDLRLIITCGTVEGPVLRACCRAAEIERRTADVQTKEILDAYLRRNCRTGPHRK